MPIKVHTFPAVVV